MACPNPDDFAAIVRLRSRYSWAFDEGDIETFMTLFAPGAECDLGQWGHFKSLGEIRSGNQGQMIEPGAPRQTWHSVDTPLIDVEGDRGEGRWYTTIYHRPREGDAPIRLVGRYFDRYRKVDGEWFFEHVRLETDWFAGY